jgi:glycosyltransferase involved in cell wall biosynthesis/ubiquinone/menaquinone biosynthesis C-methylase UbiE
MRIAVVGPTHPFKGGIAQHTTALAHRLTAAGHEVVLVTWERQYPRRLYPGRQTVEQVELPPFEPTHRLLAWNRPDTWWRAGRALRGVDLVVFAHVTPVQAPAYRAMIAALRQGRARVAVICHNVLPHERRSSDVRLVSALLGAADLVVVHSDEQAALARTLTRAPVAVSQLPPAMPAAFTPRAAAPGEHRRLLFFGLVRPYKGLDVLLHALARGPSEIGLRVAGEFWGGAEPTVRLVRELGLDGRVEIRDGYVPAHCVPDLFADVDALVLPYRHATGSQGVWLGFQFGVPVIVTRTGSLAADVQEGVDGLVAEPDDVDSLAGAIGHFYRDGRPGRMRAQVRPVNPEPYWQRYLDALTSPPATRSGARPVRRPQLAYSETQAKMLDEQHRRAKARKIIRVLHHFLGRGDLSGLTALDIGCSAGFIADELAGDGARTVGVDIDAPGLARAHERFGGRVEFLCASADALPVADESLDVVVFNHIYEHVVDADAVVSEIHRVLRADGVAYLGLGNKYQLVEPHYRLPLLSWLPQRQADGYVRRFGRADEYYERYRSRRGLQELVRGFHVWDYTVAVIRAPRLFASDDQVGTAVSRVPTGLLRAALPIVPTYIWVASKGSREPADSAPVTHLDLSAVPRP